MHPSLVVHTILALTDLGMFMAFSIEPVFMPLPPDVVSEMRSRFVQNEGNTEYKHCFPKVECYEGSSCYDSARDTVCIFKIDPLTCTCNTTRCTDEDWSRVGPLSCQISSTDATVMAFVMAFVLGCTVNMVMLFGIVDRRRLLLLKNVKEMPLTMILLGGWHLVSITFNLVIRVHKTAPQDRYFHVEWLYFVTQGWVFLFSVLGFVEMIRLLNVTTNRVTPAAVQMTATTTAASLRPRAPPATPPPSPCMDCNTNRREVGICRDAQCAVPEF
jgi:hypothetical protein